MTLFRGLVFILALLTIFLGVVMHQSDVENDRERNIFNFTENQFNVWNSSQWQVDELNSTNLTMSDAFSFRIKSIIFKTVDVIGYSLFQGVKLGIEFGYEKAYAYNPDSFVSLAKLILVVVIIGMVIPVIVPMLAILYLLFEGCKWLIKRFKNERRQKN